MSILSFLRVFFCCLVLGWTGYPSDAQRVALHAGDPHIQYEGRVHMTDTAAQLIWTATAARIHFKGTGISVLLKDQEGINTYNVLVDGKLTAVIHPDTTKTWYTLGAGLDGGEHSVELFKRTEGVMGKTLLYGFSFEGAATVLEPFRDRKRKIEFFGNSITCGYADEDTAGKDRGTAPFENGYLAYAAITARHYNAQLSCIARSGIGITISWFPQIMSEMYDLVDPTDSTRKWNFAKFTPDLVVINLFQNDSWLVHMPEHEQFKARFGNKAPDPDVFVGAYQHFLQTVRSKYPGARILCILGSMDATKAGSPWPGYIEQAVAAMHDGQIYTHFIPFKGTNGHPSVKEQQEMADDLIAYIDAHIQW